MRTKLKITEGIFPMPVLMVATYNEDGSVNVMNAADLTGYRDIRLVGAECCAQSVMRNGNNVCALIGNVVEKLAEAAGLVEQLHGKSQAAVTGDKTLLDDALNEADIDIAAGEQAHDTLALDIDLALQDGGNGRCTGGLDYLLTSLHEKQYCLGDFIIRHGDDIVGIAVYKLNGDVAGGFDRNAVCNG